MKRKIKKFSQLLKSIKRESNIKIERTYYTVKDSKELSTMIPETNTLNFYFYSNIYPCILDYILPPFMIKKLEQNLAEDISAQQVITSLPDCVKELVENSIDAKSTSISVYLDDYGKKKIIVSDDGVGISNFDCIGKVNHF